MISKLTFVFAVLTLSALSTATQPPMKNPRASIYHLTCSVNLNQINTYEVDGTFAARLKPGQTYRFHFYRQFSFNNAPPNFTSGWTDVTSSTWTSYDPVEQEVHFNFDIGFFDLGGGVLVMAQGKFGSAGNGNGEKDEVQVLMADFPTDDPPASHDRPGSVVPITTFRPYAPTAAIQPVDDRFETDDDYGGQPIQFLKKDANLSAVPGASWVDSGGSVTGSNHKIVRFTVPNLDTPGLVAILGKETYDDGAFLHTETTGVVRGYPQGSTPTFPSNGIAIKRSNTSSSFAAASIDPSLLKAMLAENALQVLAVYDEDPSNDEEDLDDIWDRVHGEFEYGPIIPIRFTSTNDLITKLQGVSQNGSMPIGWLEIVAHGSGYNCGPINICDLPTFQAQLRPLVRAFSHVYLSGCNTGACMPDISIAEELANYDICSIYGAVGYLNDCTLAELPLGNVCVIQATPLHASAHASSIVDYLCSQFGTGKNAFREFSKTAEPGAHNCITDVRIPTSGELNDLQRMLADIIGSTTKGESDADAPNGMAPELTVYLGDVRYEFVANGKLLRRPNPGDPATVWRVHLSDEMLKKLQDVWTPKPVKD